MGGGGIFFGWFWFWFVCDVFGGVWGRFGVLVFFLRVLVFNGVFQRFCGCFVCFS